MIPALLGRTSCSEVTKVLGSKSPLSLDTPSKLTRITNPPPPTLVYLPPSHSFRFEHKLGPRLKVVALIDPAVERAEAVLAGKRASFVESAYRDTIVYKTVEDFREAMTADKEPQ